MNFEIESQQTENIFLGTRTILELNRFSRTKLKVELKIFSKLKYH